ncbi:50S ribosomal protein L6 [Acetobacterium wieringae]|uniref:Large ribosomal subunit protein uL6 n=1 Tax=Acetobacterium wieringae TaxID=52694 RepID=A0A1F2PM65_9FIRM|nr:MULTISPECIES: 50S ribosomal protein L6 [Acetobacterium]MEA4806622.1 50S ribosomal protein L6 [Acetobacterium wieringae]OFV71831.1 50S ribosomal protein L6 [Acetobacterium wieringae]OXS24734.1 MAG: 50S ribosomal protein L6 [Acetobacterium sp. MES1]TYC85657.1 50S ribosomal protein L6 [Acetobacterium wieringae]URN85037.1 50S ribosomal protein L6 [Acetobacterium wieringae]
MSRVGKAPVAILPGVDIKKDGQTLTVKGPLGQLVRTFHPDVIIDVQDSEIVVTRPSESKLHKSLHGLTRALIQNMVTGVSTGFTRTLEISGVGYRAEKKGNKLVMNLGYSHPVEMEDPEGVEAVPETNTKVVIKGISKEAVGAHAANIRAKRPPEPYKGHGVRYSDEVIRRKEGKTGK